MKSKILIVIAVVAVLGGLFFFTKSKSEDSVPIGIEGGEMLISEGEKHSGSLLEMVNLGIPLKCTYGVEGNEFEGIFKGRNFRGTVQSPNGQESTIVMKDNCMYTWVPEDKQGVSWCLDDSEMDDIWAQPEAVSAGMPNNYKCAPTIATDATFSVPSDVEFMDMSSMMDTTMLEGMEDFMME